MYSFNIINQYLAISLLNTSNRKTIALETCTEHDVLWESNNQKQTNQLNTSYILPKYTGLTFDNNAWYTSILWKKDGIYIVSKMRPHFNIADLQTKYMLYNFYMVQNGRQQKLAQLAADGIVVQGSYSPDSNILFIILQRQQDNKQFYYDAIGILCSKKILHVYSSKQQCSSQPAQNQIFVIIPSSKFMLQVHQLPQSKSYTIKHKNVSFNRKAVYQKCQILQRILIFIAGLNCIEYQISIDWYELTRDSQQYIKDLSSEQQQQLIQNISQKTKIITQDLKNFVCFNQLTNIAVYGNLLDNDKLNNQQAIPCYFQYDETFEQLFCVYKIPQQHNNHVVGFKQFYYFKCYIFEHVPYYAQTSEKSLKLIQDFVIKNSTECEGYNILPFNDLMLQPGQCRITYSIHEYFNSTVNIELADKFMGKISLLSFHVQTSSVIKLQASSQIQRQNNPLEQNIIFNHQLMGAKIATFVKQGMQMQSTDNDIDQLNLYQFLAFQRNFYINQPHIFSFKSFQLWIVPNVAKELCTLYLIKTIPYLPLEHVHSYHLPLFKTNNVEMFEQLILQSDRQQETNTSEKSIYDIEIQNAPHTELCYEFRIQIDEQNNKQISGIIPDKFIPQKLQEQQINEKQTNNSESTEQGSNNTNSNNNVGNNNQLTNQKEQSQLNLSELNNTQIQQQSKSDYNTNNLGLFESNLTTLCFTQNETTLYFILTHMYGNDAIYNGNNYILNKKQIHQMGRCQNTNECCQNNESNEKLSNEIQKNFQKIQIRYYNVVNNQIYRLVVRSTFNFQNNLDSLSHIKTTGKFINFFVDICMHYSQNSQFYLKDLLQLCFYLFGATYGNLLNQYYEQINDKSNKQYNMMIQLMMTFIQNNKQLDNEVNLDQQSGINVNETYTFIIQSLLRLIFTSIILIKQLRKSTQQCKKSFEFFIAEYILNVYLSKQLQIRKHTAQIIKMHSSNSCSDYSDKINIHPLKKQIQQNIQIQQYVYNNFIGKYKEFYQLLYLQEEALINKASPQYQRLIYFVNLHCVLDNYSKYQETLDSIYSGQNKQVLVELNRYISGSHVLMNIFGELQFLINTYQNFLRNETFYSIIKQKVNKNIADILIQYISQVCIQMQAQNYIMLYHYKHHLHDMHQKITDKIIVPQYLFDNMFVRSQKLGSSFLLNYSCTELAATSPEIQKMISQDQYFGHYQNKSFSFKQFMIYSKFQFQKSISSKQSLTNTSMSNAFDTASILAETSSNSIYHNAISRNSSAASSTFLIENAFSFDNSFQSLGNSVIASTVENNQTQKQQIILNGQLDQLISYQQEIIKARFTAFAEVKDLNGLYLKQKSITKLECHQKYNQLIKNNQKYQLQEQNEIKLQRMQLDH